MQSMDMALSPSQSASRDAGAAKQLGMMKIVAGISTSIAVLMSFAYLFGRGGASFGRGGSAGAGSPGYVPPPQTPGGYRVPGLEHPDYTSVFLYAANGFPVNEDFDLSGVVKDGMDRWDYMKVLKDATERKPTMLVINDKFLMDRVTTRMRVPLNKVLFSVKEGFREEDVMAELLALQGNFQPFIIKPTHTSEGMGTKVVLSADKFDIGHCLAQIKENMNIRAGPHESWTLRHLSPGVIVEELYVSEDLGTGQRLFKPYEIKFQVLWGRAFLGVMEGDPPGEGLHPQYWIRRDGTSSCDVERTDVQSDCFPNLDKAVKENLAAMVAYSEDVALQLGAPWLRVDWFIGSKKYGLRMNELAYGSGIPYPLLDNDCAHIMVKGWQNKLYKVQPRDSFFKSLHCHLANPEAIESVQCDQPDPSDQEILNVLERQYVGLEHPAYSGPFTIMPNGFKANEDCDLRSEMWQNPQMDRWEFMKVLKAGTENKPTMLVINDKFLMNRVCETMGIPLNDVLFEVDEHDDDASIMQKLNALKANFKPFIIKPTHTSESMGTMVVPTLEKFDVNTVLEKVKDNMKIRALPHESWTLRHLKPGVMAEDLYQVDDLGTGDRLLRPYEIKLQVVWGRTLLGIMEGHPAGEDLNTMYWIRRDGTSSCDIDRSMNHVSSDCFPQLDEEAKKHLPKMVEYAESIAKQLGTPWLRVDFFMGSPTKGLRMNELAYGSGVPYPLLDNDVAKLMVKGYMHGMSDWHPRDYFLGPLGCSLKGDDVSSVVCAEKQHAVVV